jgi:hypothetical protein
MGRIIHPQKSTRSNDQVVQTEGAGRARSSDPTLGSSTKSRRSTSTSDDVFAFASEDVST